MYWWERFRNRLPAIRAVILCGNGALCVFDKEGKQITEYQATAGRNRKALLRVLRDCDTSTVFEVQCVQGGPLLTFTKETLPVALTRK